MAPNTDLRRYTIGIISILPLRLTIFSWRSIASQHYMRPAKPDINIDSLARYCSPRKYHQNEGYKWIYYQSYIEGDLYMFLSERSQPFCGRQA